jgi:hypothetical protein
MPMQAYADLEIELHRREADSYGVVLRFTPPEVRGEEEVLNFLSPSAPLHFNRAELLPTVHDPAAYGKVLSNSLFSNQEVKEYFAKIKSVTQSREWGLRLRLFAAAELHDLLWETLQDPDDGTPLAASQRLLFSRYLSSQDWRRICSRPRRDLKALIVIANPSDIEKYQLDSLDLEKELTRIREALQGFNIPVSELPANGQKATLDNLVSRLREGCDILYLLCHGALVENDTKEMAPWLYLENEAGQTARVPGQEIVSQLKLMEQPPPRLVILASCESSGLGTGFCADDKGAFVALGPLLAEAGVPAVLAMQGKISVDTVSQFMPLLFGELNTDGQIDRAIATARNTVRSLKRPDWWMPVLFMRLKRGRLWYKSGFIEGDFNQWPMLMEKIKDGNCTPILGPGMTESIIGCPTELARIWAQTYRFPLAPDQAEDLPYVFQYVSVDQKDPSLPLKKLLIYYCQTIQKRFSDILDDSKRTPGFCQEICKRAEGEDFTFPRIQELSDMISLAGKHNRRHPDDPHAVLAGLPLDVYITANPDNLMFDALKDAGKNPHREFCRWKDTLAEGYDPKSTPVPDVNNPIVFHIFGYLENPSSLVLSQDDYFDFLTGMSKNYALIPEKVRSSLARRTLLFTGFQMIDWKFRILLRSIISHWEGSKNRPYNIAAQIDPDEENLLDPQGALRYLEKYYNITKITTYRGRPEDFARDLKGEWDEYARGAA